MKYLVLTVLPLFLVAGCSRLSAPQGDVSGTVSYRGRPLPGGIITFVSDHGLQNSAVIGPDGHYQLKTVPGPAKVTVNNRMLRTEQGAISPRLKSPSPGAEATPRIEGTYVPIPAKYLSADESGLKCDIQKGSQTQDFTLGAS